MHDVNLSQLDLNLLLALDALLTERNVTRAAARLGRTQPATSHALARLREALGDPILVREGRGMTPTPRALAMQEPLARALAELGRILSEEGAFDAARSERRFGLVCPDLLAAFLPELLGDMTRAAPRVSLEVRAPFGDTAAALEGADLALAPATLDVAGLVRRGLGRVSWAVLARRDHPGVRARLTAKRWCAYPHVQIRARPGETPSFVDVALQQAGLERRIGLHVPSFLVAPEVVSRTDLFFTAPAELVRPLAERLGLAMHRPPIAIPDIPVAAYWPERLHADAGHRWFRDRVAAHVLEVLTAAGTAARRGSGARAARR